MKAVLVVDMPHDCVYCPCWRGGNDEFPFDDCTAMQRPLTNEEEKSRPEWCPLKPMPKRMLALVHMQNGNIVNVQETSFANGWNACLKEIEE